VHANAISQPHALVVLWALLPKGVAIGWLRQHAFWVYAIAQAVRTQEQRGFGEAQLQQWHLWLVDPSPSVCVLVSRVVVLQLAAIWAMEQGRKRLLSLVYEHPRQ
jgi:hypothetical protein